MVYRCLECYELVEPDELGQRIRCPYCGGKVLFKEKSEVVRTIKAK